MRNAYVDRLRGLAALMVVLSHACGYIPAIFYHFPDQLRVAIMHTGYHGVFVFFTISGFLITNKLVAASDHSGRFSIGAFYRDRVGRIAPCLVLMLCAAVLVASFGIERFSIVWSTLPKRLWYIFTFRYNLYMPAGSRLWDPLWSLSVEEVFYLCFPPLLLFVRNRWILIAGLVGLAVIGPIWRAQTVQPYPYLCNFDGIALGALAALALAITKSWNHSRLLLRCLRYAGAILIGANFIWTQDTIARLTWGPTLMGIGSAVYLLGTARSDARRFVAFMPLEKLGELSYEIYLSHMFVIIALHPIFMSSFTNTDPRIQIAMGYIWPVLLLATLLFGSRHIARFYSEPANRFIKSGRWETAPSVDQNAEKYSALQV